MTYRLVIEIKSLKWQIDTDHDIGALVVGNVDSDDNIEVIYGDGQWGDIHCYDAMTGSIEKWAIRNEEHGVTNIAIYDTDLDGNLEVLWGAGATSTGKDVLFVHDIRTLNEDWRSIHIDGPMFTLDVGDIDSDGNEELVYASFESNAGYDDGTVFIYDVDTLELEWMSPENLFGRNALSGIYSLKIGGVDNDGEKEIVIGTDDLYDGTIYVIDGKTHVLEGKSHVADNLMVYSVALADIDNDNEMEIIVGTEGSYIYVLDGATGVMEWRSISLGTSAFFSAQVVSRWFIVCSSEYSWPFV